MRHAIRAHALRLALNAIAFAGVTVAHAGPAPTSASPASTGSLSVAEVRERGVKLLQFAGLPADSAVRRTLLAAFHAEMDRGSIPYQKREGAEWAPADTHASVFRLVDAAPVDETWTLDLSIRVPPEVRAVKRTSGPNDPPLFTTRVSPARAARGLIVAATAQAPARGGRPVPAEPIVFSLVFADARRVVVPSRNLPGGGYAYPWTDAGRVVARAALEALHRASGQMKVDQRADLTPATRVESTP